MDLIVSTSRPLLLSVTVWFLLKLYDGSFETKGSHFPYLSTEWRYLSCSRLWRLRGRPQRPPRARLSILAWAWAAAGSEPGKCSWGRPCLASPATHAALKFENHRIILLHIFWSIRSEQLKVQSRPETVETLINSSHFTLHRAAHRMTL